MRPYLDCKSQAPHFLHLRRQQGAARWLHDAYETCICLCPSSVSTASIKTGSRNVKCKCTRRLNAATPITSQKNLFLEQPKRHRWERLTDYHHANMPDSYHHHNKIDHVCNRLINLEAETERPGRHRGAHAKPYTLHREFLSSTSSSSISSTRTRRAVL